MKSTNKIQLISEVVGLAGFFSRFLPAGPRQTGDYEATKVPCGLHQKNLTNCVSEGITSSGKAIAGLSRVGIKNSPCEWLGVRGHREGGKVEFPLRGFLTKQRASNLSSSTGSRLGLQRVISQKTLANPSETTLKKLDPPNTNRKNSECVKNPSLLENR